MVAWWLWVRSFCTPPQRRATMTAGCLHGHYRTDRPSLQVALPTISAASFSSCWIAVGASEYIRIFASVVLGPTCHGEIAGIIGAESVNTLIGRSEIIKSEKNRKCSKRVQEGRKMMSSKSSIRLGTSLVLVLSLCLCASATIVNSDLGVPRDNAGNISTSEQISQILDLFNTNRLAENWITISEVVSPNCSRDMESYLQGLTEHSRWAMKSKLHLLFFQYKIIRILIIMCNLAHTSGNSTLSLSVVVS